MEKVSPEELPSGRYGWIVAATKAGRWYWCPQLQTVDFVPQGKQKTVYTANLSDRMNTHAGSLLFIVGAVIGHRGFRSPDWEW